MSKLSGLPVETTFGLADFLVKVKAAGAGDVDVTLQNFLNAIGASLFQPCKFFVYRSAAWTSGSPAVVNFDTKVFDTGSNVDVVTNKGRFTAPFNGFYRFDSVVAVSATAGSGVIGYIYKNGAEYIAGSALSQGASTFGAACATSTILQLIAGDYIEIGCYGSGNAGIAGSGPMSTWFSGSFMWAT